MAAFLLFVLALILNISSAVVGQQTGQRLRVDCRTVTPSDLPAAQPIPDAAVSASGVQAAKGDDAKSGPDTSGMVKLGPGDLIEVSVYNVPELASKVRVSNTGDIYLPLIDYVHVDGLTQEEAQSLIQKRLEDGGFVRNPHVTIFVDDAASQGVTLLGEVSKPGIYPNTSSHKLYEVVSQAGGFTSSASRKIAILRRNQPDPIHVDLPRNLADDTSKNVDVMPGDTITVPRAPIIYVVGDVGRPSGSTGGQWPAYGAAGACTGRRNEQNSQARSSSHHSQNSQRDDRVEAGNQENARSESSRRYPARDDILFVPVSGGKILANRTFEAAINAATAVTIYSVHP